MSPRLSQAAATVAIFVVVGPLAGALIFAVLIALRSMTDDSGMGLVLVYATFAFLPLAYLIGGAQAAITGLVTALYAWRKGSAPVWVTLVAALASGSMFVWRGHEDWEVTAFLLAVHSLSALACWLLVSGALGWKQQQPPAT